ncbi:tetratricopeptide repeat protein [Ktedonobacter sp. SOSP1-85]|uniref:FxSxx-COOH system tetratricopeptide repeat protein n=1 Tax=Ktedonobacter sp. SOSP1-85 TaxID=2778367 RepID=UPI0019169341|nr:FxSxx-COOH system tetratricopeptide repeat protein [Ktedonobacter sp. SOSP1-85]GHO76464.1 tetratricopeptide repeat protein [Ktedonobacter sp. SOSP1-85]
MDDGSTYNVKNDGCVQGQIVNAYNPHIIQHYHASESRPTPSKQVWNVPYQRNPYFTGRKDLLDRLHEQLSAGQDIALSQAISGLGGVGKTQLAVEYAYLYEKEYHYVLWVRAESEERLISSYVSLAHELNLPQKDEQDQNKVVEAVKRWLRNNDGWLLIFDNADEPGILSKYVPTSPRGHCLYTTRASTLGRLARRLPVESFTPEKGALFLLRRTQIIAVDTPLEQASEQERELALQITKELGGLPLALDQAGAYIEEAQTSLEDYLHLYQQRRAELLAKRGDIAPDHPEPVAATWSLSFERVAQCSPAAADLLRLLAFLAPDDIPEEIITAESEYLSETLAPVAADALKLDDALKALLAYSLIKRDQKTKSLSIHRLVQAVLQDVMPSEERKLWIECAIQAVKSSFPNVYEFEQWEACERWLSHAQLCFIWAEQEKIETLEVANLLDDTGYYLLERDAYIEAERLHKRALAIREQKLGSQHLTTAISLNNLALCYRGQRRDAEAEPLLERVLVIREQNLDPTHVAIVISINNLARLYQDQGRYKEAEALFGRIFEIYQQGFYSNDLVMATCLNNLALLFMHQGRYEEAEPIYKLSLEINLQVLGPTHPRVLLVQSNLAALYQEQGRYKEAEPLLRQLLVVQEQMLGPLHPDVSQSLINLAAIWLNQGRYDDAEPLLKRALAIREQAFGLLHPETAKSLNSLAALYLKQERYDEAKFFARQGLAIREKVLNELHPDIVGSLVNLGSVYLKQENYERAEPLYKRALMICERSLGPKHSRTQEARVNYTALLQAMGQSAARKQAQVREKLRGKQKKKTRQRDNRLKPQ